MPVTRKASGKKAAPKNPKKVIAELTEQNELLTQELNMLKEQTACQHEKLDLLTDKVVGAINKKEFGITDLTDIRSLSIQTLMDMLAKLVVKRRIQDVSVEARVEDLETRVTEMSLDIAKMTKKTLAYELGLQDIAKATSLEAVQDRVYELQLIAGQAYHSFAANDPERKPEQLMNGVDESPDSPAQRSLNNARKLNLVSPPRKFAGETHIRNMHRDLRLYVMKELSQEKASGADWRMFGTRVGIDPETLSYWESCELECPMGRVLAQWGDSPSATVRMLHRHLMSPQLRCTILGKRVADFYDVDWPSSDLELNLL